MAEKDRPNIISFSEPDNSMNISLEIDLETVEPWEKQMIEHNLKAFGYLILAIVHHKEAFNKAGLSIGDALMLVTKHQTELADSLKAIADKGKNLSK